MSALMCKEFCFSSIPVCGISTQLANSHSPSTVWTSHTQRSTNTLQLLTELLSAPQEIPVGHKSSFHK